MKNERTKKTLTMKFVKNILKCTYYVYLFGCSVASVLYFIKIKDKKKKENEDKPDAMLVNLEALRVQTDILEKKRDELVVLQSQISVALEMLQRMRESLHSPPKQM